MLVGACIKIVDSLEDYRSSVREPTWNALHKYAKILREKHIKIAFFSSSATEHICLTNYEPV